MRFFIYYIFILCLSCENGKKGDNSENKIIKIEDNNSSVSVNTQLIQPEKFQKQVISNGKIKALQKSELHFKTSERLFSVNIRNGQKVIKGQTLAYLDNALLKNQLEKSEIEFDKAKNKLQEEKINYGVSNKADDQIPPEILKSLQMKSGYLEAKNSLENAQLHYNQTFLKAPFNGVVANVETNVGNYISSSEVFCTIFNPTQLEVLFSILESDVEFLYKKQSINIILFADKDKKYRGYITEINPLVSENGLVKVKAKISTTNTSLFDGMHVKVFINHPMDDVIVIPKEALVLRSNKEVVFTVKSNLAKWNYVKVLDENSTSYAIKEGLKIGDTIIVSGNMNLSHDAHVNSTFIYQEDNN